MRAILFRIFRLGAIAVAAISLLLAATPAWADLGPEAQIVSLDNVVALETVPDGAGGAIYLLTVQDGDYYDFVAQRMDVNTQRMWGNDGITICDDCVVVPEPSGDEVPHYADIVSDGQGGAIVVWQKWVDTSYQLYAQRLNADGIDQWSAGGVEVCEQSPYVPIERILPYVVSDSQGGVIITFTSHAPQAEPSKRWCQLNAQRLRSDGTRRWGGIGVEVDYLVFDEGVINNWTFAGTAIVTDLQSPEETILAWYWPTEQDYNPVQLRVQRLDGTGHLCWNGGYPVQVNGYLNFIPGQYPHLCANPEGGAYLAWDDFWKMTGYYYPHLALSRLNGITGESIWTKYSVWMQYGTPHDPQLVSDGSGGVVMSWTGLGEGDPGNGFSIYVARFASANGDFVWEPIPISPLETNEDAPRMTSVGNGEAIVSWRTLSFQTPVGVGAQKFVIETGEALWTGGPATIATSSYPGTPYRDRVVPDQVGGAIFAWVGDAGNLLAGHYYDPNIVVTITSNVDASDENSFIFGCPAGDAEVYEVTLQFDPGTLGRNIAPGEITLDNDPIIDPLTETNILFFSDGDITATGPVDAGSGLGVIEHAYFGGHGRAKEVPVRLNGEVIGNAWLALRSPDINGDGLVNLTDIVRLAEIETTGGYEYYVDFSEEWGVIDLSDVSLFSPHRAHRNPWSAGKDGGGDPQKVAEIVTYENQLGQNYPNPFNPTTTIEYAVAREGRVKLAVYDVTGTLVKTLVDEIQSPNSYAVQWNGTNNAGASVSSGMYYYRFSANELTQTRKMLLLK
jgi:hypothetical protein